MYIGAFDAVQFWNGLSMNFVSGWFLLLVGVLAVYYYLIPRRWQWVVLLLGSVFFCLWGGWQVLAVPALVTVIIYCAARMIEVADRQDKKKRRAMASSAAAVLITALALVKLSQLYRWTSGSFVFPVGLSYYTFSAISYVMDVYRGREHAQRNPLKLLCFILYFPKILQGPISRYQNLAPQMFSGSRFSYRNVCFGMQLALWGYFKKMVIADRLNILVQTVFSDLDAHGGLLILAATMLGGAQLYCDFSGCMDIAGGISQMFGVELEQNFDHPFKSRSAAEFWRRWHITLGAWFKDYVYMPLAVSPRIVRFSNWFRKHVGKRFGRSVATAVPLAAVWILTGLWHGTGWGYFVWGIYWGTIIIFSTLFAGEIEAVNKRLHIRTDAPSWKVFQMARTFLIFCGGRLLTMPGTLAGTWKVLSKIFTDGRPWELVDGTLFALGLSQTELYIAVGCLLLLWAVSLLQEKYELRESIAQWNIAVRCAFYAGAVLFVLVFGMWGLAYDAASFVYMNF